MVRVVRQELETHPSHSLPGAVGVIFDSVVGEDMPWLDFDTHLDGAVTAIFDACGKDAFCRGKRSRFDTSPIG